MDGSTGNEIPFNHLTPDVILQAVESLGYLTSGRLLALNSYENRVYQVGIEDETPVIVKFYRPGRWSRAAIIEEHQFAKLLVENDVPVVPPISVNNQTLHQYADFSFAIYARKPGRAPDVSIDADLQQLGRLLARIHNVGQYYRFEHREKLSVKIRGVESQSFILQNNFLSGYLRDNYHRITSQLLELLTQKFEWHNDVRHLSIHGDFHLGNILSDGKQFYIVDLDDCIHGPAVQDIWMLLSGEQDERQHQLNAIMQGYTQFREFDSMELALIESLKTLRIIHYAAWLARRWHDPAFPQAFPWFNTPRFWEEHIQALQEQLFNLQNSDNELSVSLGNY